MIAKLPSKLILLLVGACFTCSLNGQQIHLQTPFNSNSSSFYENIGVNFGFSLAGGDPNATGSRVVGLLPNGQLGQNINFSQSNNAVPSFGGFDPNSGARFGFSRRSPNGSGFSLGITLAQGNSRTSTSVTPSITIPNGGIGTISSGAFRPFVTGVTPVVGLDNGVTRGIASGRLQPYDAVESERERESKRRKASSSGGTLRVSSANYGDLSVSEIKAQREAAQASRGKELHRALENVKAASKKEDYRIARINLRKAIKLTQDESQKEKLKSWLKKLSDKR